MRYKLILLSLILTLASVSIGQQQTDIPFSTLLEHRFSTAYLSANCELCELRSCVPPFACASIDRAQQDRDILDIIDQFKIRISSETEVPCIIDGSAITQKVYEIDMVSLPLPLTLAHIRACSGTESFVEKSALATISGYTVIDEIIIDDYHGMYDMYIDGVVRQLNLREFLELLYIDMPTDHDVIKPHDYIACGEEQCETIVSNCSPEEKVRQQDAIRIIKKNAINVTLNYPLTIHLIDLCDGTKFWVLEEEMVLLRATSASQPVRTEVISNMDQLIGICAPVDGLGDELLIDLRLSHPTCDNRTSGSIFIEVADVAVGRISRYSIDGGLTIQNNPLFQNLSSGVYSILVTDAGRSIITFDGNVKLESPICPEICDNGIDDDGDGNIDCADGDCGIPKIMDVRITEPTCPSGGEGMIEVIASGYSLSYSIDGGENYQVSSVFSNLESGRYELMIRDTHADGYSCESIVQEIILRSISCIEICDNGTDDDGDGLADADDPDCDGGAAFSIVSVVSLSPTIALCPSPSDGSITIESTGSKVVYSIDGGSTYQKRATFAGLFAGTYEVQIKNLLNEEIRSYSGNPIILESPQCIEICDNGIDDDGNGLIDCKDPACDSGATSESNICQMVERLTALSMASNQVLLHFENYDQSSWEAHIENEHITAIEIIIDYTSIVEVNGMIHTTPRTERYSIYSGTSIDIAEVAVLLYEYDYDSPITAKLKIATDGLCTSLCDISQILSVETYVDEVEIIVEENPEVELPEFECGDEYVPTPRQNNETIASISEGDILYYNGFPIAVSGDASCSNGRCIGNGVLALPFNKKTVAITFDLSNVNSVGQAGGGSIIVQGQSTQFMDLTPSVGIGNASGWCQPSPPPPGLLAGNIDPVTGLDEWGFDPNTGIHTTTGSAYDEEGFDINGIHQDTRTPYNEEGCSRENLDINNNFCGIEPAVQTFINEKKETIESDVSSIISSLEESLGDKTDLQRLSCDQVREDLDAHFNNKVSLTREFIFGKDDLYFSEGMSNHFSERPKEMILNIERDENVILLDSLHQELYDCDKLLNALKDQQVNFSTDIDQEIVLQELKKRMAKIDEVLIQQLEDPTFYNEWLTQQIKEIVADLGAEGDIGNVEMIDGLRSFRLPKMQLQSTGLSSSMVALDDFWPERISERAALRRDIEFGITHGHQYINGIHRAFFLEQIIKERSLRGYSSLVGGGVMPLSIEKNIGGVKYTIMLDKISISGAGSTLSAYIILEDPADASRRLVFGAENIGFGPTGISGDGVSRLNLLSEVELALNNSAKLVLRSDSSNLENSTYVEWDCSGFVAANVVADIVFCQDFIIPVDADGNSVHGEFFEVNIQTKVFNWLDFFIETQGQDARLKYTSFRMAKYEDLTWTLNQMIIDMSAEETPKFVPPIGYKSPELLSSNTLSPEWKGFYINELSVTLPNQFNPSGSNISLGAEDLLIDGTGVSVSLLYKPENAILKLEEGNAGGWPFSVHDFGLKVLHNHIAGGEFNGQIKIPLFKEPLDYEAIIYPDNYYKLAIMPSEEDGYTMDIFLATAQLEKNSTIELELRDHDFTAVANLTGTLAINETKTTDYPIQIPKLGFSGFRVSNISPYFDPGQWEIIGGNGGKFSVFGVDITNVKPFKGSGDNEAGLGIELMIDLADEIGLKASAGIGIMGELQTNSSNQQQSWKHKNVVVRHAYIDQNIKEVVHVKGGLTFFDSDEATANGAVSYGKGFKANLTADFTKLNFSVEAAAMFGRTGDFNYFFVDALADIPISLGVGPLNIVGFGGGVSYHMSSDFDDQDALFASLPSATLNQLGYGLSGSVYEPDGTLGLGLKASILLAHAQEKIFNGSLSFGITFNTVASGGGINEMFLQGNGHFLSPLDKSIGPKYAEVSDQDATRARSSALSAWLALRYNFSEKIFDGELGMYLNAGLLTGTGKDGRLVLAKMYFAPEDWFINIGTPDNRAGAKVQIPVIGDVKLSGYFNIGTDIPDFPALPENVRRLTGIVKTNEDLRKSGGGFMFGADLSAKVEIDAFIAKAQVQGQLGFDIMLRDYGDDAVCINAEDPTDIADGVGINGWYAAGQMYAFIEGSLKLFGINVLNAGLAAALQARLPNPFWAQAALGFRIKLLFISKTIKANLSFGKRCLIADDNGNNKIGLDVVMYSDPIDGAKDVNVDVQPTLYLAVPIKRKFYIGEDYYEVSDLRVSLSTPDYRVSTRIVDAGSEYKYTIIPDEILPGNTEMTITSVATISKNGAFLDEEVRTFLFTTGDSYDDIPLSNIAYSYPVAGQYDFFPDEYSRGEGYLKLVSGQSDLLENAEIQLTGSTGSVIRQKLSYNPDKRLISFALSSANVAKEEVYKMEIIKEDRSLLEMYFRTSEYGNYNEKIIKVQEKVNAKNYYGSFLRTDITDIELFGDVDLYGLNNQSSLISWSVDLNNPYYNGPGGWNDIIYNKFPIHDPNCGVITYDQSIKLDESGGIEQSQSSTVLANATLYHSGQNSTAGIGQYVSYAPMNATIAHFFSLRSIIAQCIHANTLEEDISPEFQTNPSEFLQSLNPAIVDLYNTQIVPRVVPPGLYKLKSTYTIPGGTVTSRASVTFTKSNPNNQ